MGNQFLANIREVDAIVHVVRCFEDDNVVHVDGAVDPVRDKEVIDTELMLKDLDTVEKKNEKTKRQAKSGRREDVRPFEVAQKVKAHLEEMKPVRSMDVAEEDQEFVDALFLLTSKPILYVCNVDEDSVHEGNAHTKRFEEMVKDENAQVIYISADIEADIADLESAEERKEFLDDMGLEEPGVNKLIRACYRLLNLITYFTAGEKEVRAWTIEDGWKAPKSSRRYSH